MKALLSARFRLVDQLSPQELDEMFSVFERYYRDVTRKQFLQDLSEKTNVLLVKATPQKSFSGLEKVVGFSTNLLQTQTTPEGHEAQFLFSGDTVLEKEYWGTRVLQVALFLYVVKGKLKQPFKPYYWMLMSKGYKTYLLLRRNFPNSYPNPNHPVYHPLKATRDHYYLRKYGNSFEPASGLVRFEHSHGAVREGIAPPVGKVLADPDVQYFLAANPEHDDGVELACIAEVRITEFPRQIIKYFLKPLWRKFFPKKNMEPLSVASTK